MLTFIGGGGAKSGNVSGPEPSSYSEISEFADGENWGSSKSGVCSRLTVWLYVIAGAVAIHIVGKYEGAVTILHDVANGLGAGS